jgi:hypothetical protein
MEAQMIQQQFPPARKEELNSASANMPGPPLESSYVGSWGKAGHQLHSSGPLCIWPSLRPQ